MVGFSKIFALFYQKNTIPASNNPNIMAIFAAYSKLIILFNKQTKHKNIINQPMELFYRFSVVRDWNIANLYGNPKNVKKYTRKHILTFFLILR